ncbi:MAG: hypothetical protein H7222_12420 [Methylotenera sp.]|nr:hypothetical protein [Oligoflexia bacterium]
MPGPPIVATPLQWDVKSITCEGTRISCGSSTGSSYFIYKRGAIHGR